MNKTDTALKHVLFPRGKIVKGMGMLMDLQTSAGSKVVITMKNSAKVRTMT
jgi:acyl CoA:acetate/3-ketoacid CoA transferase beta subunit